MVRGAWFLSRHPHCPQRHAGSGVGEFRPLRGRCRSEGPHRENCPALLYPRLWSGPHTGTAKFIREFLSANRSMVRGAWFPLRHPHCARRHAGSGVGEFRPLRGRCRSEGPHRENCPALLYPRLWPGPHTRTAKSEFLSTNRNIVVRGAWFLSRHPRCAQRHAGSGVGEFRPLRGRCRSEGPHRENCPALLYPRLWPGPHTRTAKSEFLSTNRNIVVRGAWFLSRHPRCVQRHAGYGVGEFRPLRGRCRSEDRRSYSNPHAPQLSATGSGSERASSDRQRGSRRTLPEAGIRRCCPRP